MTAITGPGFVTRSERVLGCLLGGAVGDALGAPVEFLSLPQIRESFGPLGIEEPALAYGRVGAITDDTQMTLFVVDGLLAAYASTAPKDIQTIANYVHDAMLRWLFTQGEENAEFGPPKRVGILQHDALCARRAPGLTCRTSLLSCSDIGELAYNFSKGCGAIMRIAPIGLVETLSRVGPLANLSARHTHGHPESTFSSECFALIIAYLTAGTHLRESIELAEHRLSTVPEAAPTLNALSRALSLADSTEPSLPETVTKLGAGWVAEEALAISVFCALRAKGFAHGVRLAVNHGGDSDSTGSLTGQLLGTWWGKMAIPPAWLDTLELRTLITDLAEQLAGVEAPLADEATGP